MLRQLMLTRLLFAEPAAPFTDACFRKPPALYSVHERQPFRQRRHMLPFEPARPRLSDTSR